MTGTVCVQHRPFVYFHVSPHLLLYLFDSSDHLQCFWRQLLICSHAWEFSSLSHCWWKAYPRGYLPLPPS